MQQTHKKGKGEDKKQQKEENKIEPATDILDHGITIDQSKTKSAGCPRAALGLHSEAEYGGVITPGVDGAARHWWRTPIEDLRALKQGLCLPTGVCSLNRGGAFGIFP